MSFEHARKQAAKALAELAKDVPAGSIHCELATEIRASPPVRVRARITVGASALVSLRPPDLVLISCPFVPVGRRRRT
jgi:hypothetical protein